MRLRRPVAMMSFDAAPDSSEVPTLRREELPPLAIPPTVEVAPPIVRSAESEPPVAPAPSRSSHAPMWTFALGAAVVVAGAWWAGHAEPSAPSLAVSAPIEATSPALGLPASEPVAVRLEQAMTSSPTPTAPPHALARAMTSRAPSALPRVATPHVAGPVEAPPAEHAVAEHAVTEAPLDRAALQAGMRAAAASAAACAEPGGPVGTGKVAVTLAPSGKVTVALVEGAPFGGTSVGACVARAYRGVSVPPFEGSFTKVRASFTLR